MKDFESIAKELQRGAKREQLQKLGDSADGRALERMVDGASLESALKRGDSAALQKMLSSLLSTSEGQRLADEVQKLMQK